MRSWRETSKPQSVRSEPTVLAVRMWWLLIPLTLVACAPSAELTVTSAESDEFATSEANILAASRAFSEAYVNGDMAALQELYTEDAVLLPPGREIRGREAIARYFSPRPDRTNVSHAMTSSELKVVGELAVDVGTWSNTWRNEGEDEQNASERYLVVWRRGADGNWRIEYDMWHRR